MHRLTNHVRLVYAFATRNQRLDFSKQFQGYESLNLRFAGAQIPLTFSTRSIPSAFLFCLRGHHSQFSQAAVRLI